MYYVHVIATQPFIPVAPLSTLARARINRFVCTIICQRSERRYVWFHLVSASRVSYPVHAVLWRDR